MRFESNGEEIEMSRLSAPEWDTIEDNLYKRLANAGGPEEAQAAINDLQALRQALGKVARGEGV
jgi:hypothetical protein